MRQGQLSFHQLDTRTGLHPCHNTSTAAGPKQKQTLCTKKAHRRVKKAQPKHKQGSVGEDVCTTVLVRYLPTSFARSDLLEALHSEGFAGCFDFVYMPVNFAKGA